MPKVALSKIIADPTVQIRRSNHEPTIRRYEESFDKLPPVVVFETPDGMLLADGFHRLVAAERLGRRDIEATVRKGTREDALEFAVIANTKNADPLSPEERDDGIRRLRQLHPKWTIAHIADVMSVSEKAVRNVFRVDEVRRKVVITPDRSGGYPMTNSHYREVASAPEEAWEPLVKAAGNRGWSREVTAQAVKNLKDDRVPQNRQRASLEGKADPVVITPDGQMAVPAHVIGRQIRDMESNDAVLALEKALEHLARLRLFRPDAIVGTAGRERLERLIKELPGDIEFMQEVLETAKKHSRRMEVVK